MSDSAPSPGTSLDNDSDVDRVYFGPFKSPEKKYLGAGLAIHQPAAPSPLRRSPRLSSPIPGANGRNEDAGDPQSDDEDPDFSRSGTPDHDRWQLDEPSSLLASRITRAHDNPSPPPNAPVQLDSTPGTPDTYPKQSIPFIIPDSPSPLSRGTSPFPSKPPPSPQTQPDLISFDSFSISTNLSVARPTAPAVFTPQQTHNPSVDELLTSWSPGVHGAPIDDSSPPLQAKVDKGKSKADDESTLESAEEAAVVDALISLDVKDSSSAESAQPTPVDAMQLDDEGPRTPLRRSTRPRRSGTPRGLLAPHISSDEDESPMRFQLTPSSAITRKRKGKGKQRDISPPDEIIPDSEGEQSVGEAPETIHSVLVSEEWEKNSRKERGERKQGTPRALLQRQLGSLSPGSANLLTQLLPASRPSPVRELYEPQESTFSFSAAFPQSSSSNPAAATPVRASSPIRISPARQTQPRSPSKLHFQPSSLEDPNRTPARRVPVISLHKSGQLFPNNSQADSIMRTPVFHMPSADTPARRVNAAPPAPASSGKWQGMRFGSPSRGISKEPGGSVEPKPPWPGAGVSASVASSSTKPRSSPSRSRSPIRKGQLPFPLAPTASDRPNSTSQPGEPSGELPPNPTMPTPSPILGVIKVPRSILKQPTSKIPRIGTKPYARPAAKVKPATEKAVKAPTVAMRKVETTRLPPSKSASLSRTGSGSSSDEITTNEAGPSTLKRKRAPEKPSPIKSRPVVLIRQVAPTKSVPKSAPVVAAPSPKRPVPVPRFRMVESHARSSAVETEHPELAAEPPQSADLDMLDQLPVPPPPPPPAITPESSTDVVPHPSSSPPPDALELGSVRRTTRLRKPVFPTSMGPTQPLPTRRKVSSQQQPSGSGVFGGMSAVALKALTSSNTNRNQRYLAAKLETEVVRKEGARPESPAVKIRTIAQREQEEKGIQRKTRAERRARRSDDGLSETDEAGESSMYSDGADSSPLRRHMWGPGDEEEYESPKVNRPAKRMREGSGSDGEEEGEKKRVKWDRGLSTTIFLDEVEPRTKARPKEDMIKKGCLTPKAKAVRLDPLGNHPNAESPLKDLVEENIVVKKFVYDNDEPILPVIIVKNTRSRSKKKN